MECHCRDWLTKDVTFSLSLSLSKASFHVVSSPMEGLAWLESMTPAGLFV